MVWGTTNSHKRREVPIPLFLVDELRDHVGRKAPDDLVFAGIRNGAPLRVSTFRLRHTAASLARASGADLKVVQQMLGHASATMTLDTYGHLFEDRLDDVASALERPGAPLRGAATARNVAQCCPSFARAEFATK
jgi:integrase